MKRSQRSKGLKVFALIGILVLLLAGLLGVYFWEKHEDQATTSNLADEALPGTLTLEYGGRTYRLRDDLVTYLMMGTDETLESAFQYDNGYLNNKQADFLLLLIVDKTNESCLGLHLNRDTMMDIRRLKENGAADGYTYAHLNNAHSFGSGGKDSCRNVAEAVSRLLLGVPVDHYLAVTMDGIPVLNDLVGGVPVHIDDDLTVLDPSFEQGATVTLHGDQALRFVRTRTTVTGGTNLKRMERQRVFLNSLYERLEAKIRNDTGFAFDFADAISPYVTSDMTTNELSRLMEQLQDYRYDGIVDMRGEAQINYETGYNEFHPDEDALKQQVIELFFAPVP